MRPPSVDTSTRRIAPPPDQAKPVISWNPGLGSRCPPEGRVITDFGPNSDSNQRDLPSGLRLGYLVVSIMAMYGSPPLLIPRSHFTLLIPCQPGTTNRNG